MDADELDYCETIAFVIYAMISPQPSDRPSIEAVVEAAVALCDPPLEETLV